MSPQHALAAMVQQNAEADSLRALLLHLRSGAGHAEHDFGPRDEQPQDPLTDAAFCMELAIALAGNGSLTSLSVYAPRKLHVITLAEALKHNITLQSFDVRAPDMWATGRVGVMPLAEGLKHNSAVAGVWRANT